jgi:hypothetical protein
MNLQRFVSTVYSERIKQEYYSNLNPYLNTIYTNLKFSDIRKSYTIDYKPYITNNPTVDYVLHNLLFEKVFGNTIGNLYKSRANTIVIFPVFHDADSKNRLQDEIKEIYKPILSEKSQNEFMRKDGNSYMFLPVFSDETETTEEYTERLTTYLNRWFEFIQEQKPLPTNVRPRKYPKFETICYTVNHENGLFTDYYKGKLKPEKEKIVNKLLNTFLEKLGLNSGTQVKDPILQLTPDITTKKFKADGQSDTVKLSQFMDLLKAFIDAYKRANDKVYLKSASASDNQTLFRIYYRVNNTDYLDDFTEIKPGSSNVYKIKDKDGERIGYFIERKKITTQYLFREYTGLSRQLEKKQKTEEEIKDEIDKIKPKEEDGKEYLIETQLRGNVIYFKRVKKGDYSERYDGIVEPYMNLHIYERYKWFNFRDIHGELSSETNIKFYENILFDKKSLIDYLTSKREYTKDTKLNKEFLKINQSNTLLLEYAEYIMIHMKKTNVYKESMFGKRLETFIENTKRNIIDILFQTNSVIYMTSSHSSEKTNTKNNYKMVTYNYYEPSKEHFEKVIYDTKEGKYCGREKKCEIIQEMATNKDTEYGIVIVDVTKDMIEVDTKLKERVYCKKVRKTLRKQLQPFLRAILPRWKGGLLTRRRKYRH